MTQSEKLATIKTFLGSNLGWASRACSRLHQFQTIEEQGQGRTIAENGRGFAKPDSEILSSFARQIDEGKRMSDKQARLLFRLMPKYAGQIAPLIPAQWWERDREEAKQAEEREMAEVAEIAQGEQAVRIFWQGEQEATIQ